MNKIGNNKQEQINDIVSVVKLCSLLFSGAVFFEHYSKGGIGIYGFDYLFSMNFIIFFTLILSMIYHCGLFHQLRNSTMKNTSI